MRWTIDGAEAVLQMRSVDVNDQWEKFWNFRIQKEYEYIYENYDIVCPNLKEIAA